MGIKVFGDSIPDMPTKTRLLRLFSPRDGDGSGHGDGDGKATFVVVDESSGVREHYWHCR